MSVKILFTKPFLPPISEYNELIAEIWDRNWLTNDGPLVKRFEREVAEYLGVEYFHFLGNGTLALQVAIKALKLSGEIITTPFSYVATTSSIVWENCTPVFVDIDQRTLNIDPKLIEAKISEKTTAILATHVFGNPCQIDEIDKIAKKNNLKVIYDAAHCFGTKYQGSSVMNFGDISTLSLHATKLFHTVEGGAIVSNDSTVSRVIPFLRNFGHDGPQKFNGLGINAKNSEFHAAMGLVNLKFADEILSSRESSYKRYQNAFQDSGRVNLQQLNPTANVNYSYFPLVFESEALLEKVEKALIDHSIFARRYFNPSLNQLDYCGGQVCPVSEDVSRRVLCLPMYHTMSEKIQYEVVDIIHQYLK